MTALSVAFESQAKACSSLGSPFMARFCRLMAARLDEGDPVSDRLLGWTGRIDASGQSVPLRIAGALHALVLDGSDPDLAAVYPPHDADDDRLWAAISAAFTRHQARLMAWLDSAPQTNEVRRAAAMIHAACLLRERYDLPLSVSELGASAGLNLSFDAFRLETPDGPRGAPGSRVVLRPDWDGPAPPRRPVEIADRAGIDLNPLDPGTPEGRLRLLAYLWPDQPERLALTSAAIDLAQTRPDRGDAAPWLESRLAETRAGRLHLVYHTIAWQYFPAESQARCNAALEAAGKRARPDAPVAHLSMEADGTPGSAALTLRTWDGRPGGGVSQVLGRIDYHGRFLRLAG
ncbi:DUF2332 family protein [Rhodobacterales bacterium HKCCE2091]|nr:DUF2332 family protein [Rhodobacterales bacterium HKCCE2091]